METYANSTFLVTGATGYIASHIIKQLLEKGYKVRGTVRSLQNKEKNKFLYDLVPEKSDNLKLVEADLTDKQSLLAAVDGCEYVFHVASPVTARVPKDEKEITEPAIQGTESIFEAVLAKGVKKVVLTSSGAALKVGKGDKTITEEDWSDEKIADPYSKSKTIAERLAWKIYEENKGKFELNALCPNLVMGPVFPGATGSTESIVGDIIKGVLPGVIDVKFLVVDVRDVAEAHLKAMFMDEANGHRFILRAEAITYEEMVNILKKEFGKHGYQINDKRVTLDEIKATEGEGALWIARWSSNKNMFDNEKSIKVLGMKYRTAEETILDMGHSLIKAGLIADKTKGQ